jgi:hypothetical protein
MSASCSFCRKLPEDVDLLITSPVGSDPAVAICDRCVSVCAAMIGISSPGAAPRSGDLRCSFCLNVLEAIGVLISNAQQDMQPTYICEECVEVCLELLKERAVEIEKSFTMAGVRIDESGVVTPSATELVPSQAVPYKIVSGVSGSGRRLRIFLSCASCDLTGARALRQRLVDDGFGPWVDLETFLHGPNWKMAVRQTVRYSDVVVVCISSKSVDEAGCLQSEIADVLDQVNDGPKEGLFVIPVRLDECRMPQRLRRWLWLSLRDEKGYERLVRALQYRSSTVPEGACHNSR